MRMTVISDSRGKVLGAMQGHAPQPDTTQKPGRATKEPRSGLYAGPGQRLHEIEVGDEFVRAYTTMRRYELQRYADHVSDWELEEYLELF